MKKSPSGRRTVPFLFLGLLSLTGCAGSVKVGPMTAEHPASPEAPEAAPMASSSSLAQEPQDAVRTGPPEAGMLMAERPAHTMTPDSRDIEHGAAAHPDQHRMNPGTGKGNEGAASVQTTPTTPSEVSYTCPMHPKVVMKKPGNCPVCGMKLVRKKDVHK